MMTVTGTRIAPAALADRWLGGDSIAALAADFELSAEVVEAAIRQWTEERTRRGLVVVAVREQLDQRVTHRLLACLARQRLRRRLPLKILAVLLLFVSSAYADGTPPKEQQTAAPRKEYIQVEVTKPGQCPSWGCVEARPPTVKQKIRRALGLQ